MDIAELMKTANLEKIQQLHRDGHLAKDTPRGYIALTTALKLGKTDIVSFLTTSGYKFDLPKKLKIPRSREDSPVHDAARWGDWESMGALIIAQGPVPVTSAGNTALHLAFIHERHLVVDKALQLLVTQKNYANAINKLGLSYLHIACSRGNEEAITGFLKEGSAADTVSLNSVMWAGNNALHFAAMNSSVPAVRALTSKDNWRATLDVKNAAGLTPSQIIRGQATDKLVLDDIMSSRKVSHFHLACAQPNPTEVKIFLDSGVGVNSSVSSDFCCGDTPLHCAVRSRCSKNLQLILQRYPDLSSKNQDDMTPLHLAMYGGREATVDLMYKATNVESQQMTDQNGLNFFHVACSRNDLEMAKKLLGNGKRQLNAQVLYDRRVFSRYTALHFAVQNRHVGMIEWLIEAGANVNLGADGVDGSPLHLAFIHGHVDVIELLLKNGADPKAVRSVDDRTTLHMLVNWCTNQSEVEKTAPLLPYIEKLIELGVDVDAQDADGNTALHFAAAKGHLGSRCLRLLLQHGADINQLNHENDTPFNAFIKADFDWELHQEPGDYTFLYHHVQKLKTLGLRVDERNERCCDWMMSEENPHYDHEEDDFAADQLECMKRERNEEKAKLQQVALDGRDAESAFSMHDFLASSVKKAAEYVECDVLAEMAEREEYDKKFPIYGFLVRLRYKEAVRFVEGDLDASMCKDDGTNAKRRRVSRS